MDERDECQTSAGRLRRRLRRRRGLYAGGALLLLAPLGGPGCYSSTEVTDAGDTAAEDATVHDALGGEGSACTADPQCAHDLFCRDNAMCIVPTVCCGGCSCQSVSCNPASPSCPTGSTCEGSGTSGRCVR
jgi:hypothetical protein